MTQAELEATLVKFEGLIHQTASQIVESGVEIEHEDVAQMLRVKAWQAIQRFDERRVGTGSRIPRGRARYTPIERFVFGCMLNLRRDIEKRPKRYNRSIEELRDDAERPTIAADRFDARYLSVTDEEAFAFDAELDLPPDLTEIERQVVMLRVEGMALERIDCALGLSRAQRERVMASLREKLAHLNPAAAQADDPTHVLARRELQAPQLPAVLAA